ncbi:hypothetical protein Q3O59_08115 [Alkalimonas delamerensis]|uniref:Uncharacterized protein n=1 Tax=Alkalimonas delamerensis TaxID=265981 RepID=A0ABT9GPU8_9GAMM|nr:hypothetical protein [Alkalimonas delamerensis]MDP4528992.1 hypothetical protein [Alkalimonas delamerensis]
MKALLHQSAIQFEHLFITSSEQALYQGMLTRQQLMAELEQYGYQLQATDSADPDLPVLHFSRNPLWQLLKEVSEQNSALRNLLEQVQRQQTESTLQYDALKHQAKHQEQTLKAELEQAKQQLAESRLKSDVLKQQAEQQEQALKEELEQAKQQLNESVLQTEALKLQFTEKKEEHKVAHAELTEKEALIKELLEKNKRIEAENLKIQQRQSLLVEELKSAEHQFLQLKQLIFKQSKSE